MEDIELELTEEEINDIVMVFINTRLRPESRSVFLDSKEGIKEALFQAVFNDSYIDCVEKAIEYEQKKATEYAQE